MINAMTIRDKNQGLKIVIVNRISGELFNPSKKLIIECGYRHFEKKTE